MGILKKLLKNAPVDKPGSRGIGYAFELGCKMSIRIFCEKVNDRIKKCEQLIRHEVGTSNIGSTYWIEQQSIRIELENLLKSIKE